MIFGFLERKKSYVNVCLSLISINGDDVKKRNVFFFLCVCVYVVCVGFDYDYYYEVFYNVEGFIFVCFFYVILESGDCG